MKILTLSILLLIMALFSAQTHASSQDLKIQLIERLQDWRNDIRQRENLNFREKDLEIQFVSRLIFQVESKYHEQAVLPFMQKTLSDLQDADEMSEFIAHLNEGLESLLEKNEDVLSFMQAYLEFSSIQDPAPASEFAETRSYYDGRKMLQAQSMDLNDAAEYVDQKEREALDFQPSWIPPQENLIEEYTPQSSSPETTQIPDSPSVKLLESTEL